MITKKDVERQVARMQDEGMDVSLDWQYGRPRVMNLAESRDISPRGTRREIREWLLAYAEGWRAGRRSERLETEFANITGGV